MAYNIIDREFRDITTTTSYPFSGDAKFITALGGTIDIAAFIDIIVYSSDSEVELPLYVNKFVYAVEGAIMNIVDSYGRFVGCATLDRSVDTTNIYKDAILVGSVVYDSSKLSKIFTGVVNNEIDMSSNLPLNTSCCFVYNSGHVSAAKINTGEAVTDVVYLVAGNGTRFTNNGDTWQLNLLGEQPVTGMPVLSINSISRDHIWIAAHPESDIKVETITNGIKIRSVSDA